MPVATTRMPGDRAAVSPEILENAGKDIDEYLTSDRRYPELADQIGVFSHGMLIIMKWYNGIQQYINVEFIILTLYILNYCF